MLGQRRDLTWERTTTRLLLLRGTSLLDLLLSQSRKCRGNENEGFAGVANVMMCRWGDVLVYT